jgi:predicted DCC family thiol-disulfide oxidoreductase YuxK
MDKDLVFFDGVCNLCASSVQWIIRRDKQNRFRFTSLQGEYAAQNIQDPVLKKTDSIILLHNGHYFVKSTAVLMIARKLSFPYNLFSVFLIVPAFLRDPVYDLVARKRYNWFGKKQTCWLPDEGLKAKFIP